MTGFTDLRETTGNMIGIVNQQVIGLMTAETSGGQPGILFRVTGITVADIVTLGQSECCGMCELNRLPVGCIVQVAQTAVRFELGCFMVGIDRGGIGRKMAACTAKRKSRVLTGSMTGLTVQAGVDTAQREA